VTIAPKRLQRSFLSPFAELWLSLPHRTKRPPALSSLSPVNLHRSRE
jgi:hypothetical protein